jgi:hypothetical protein
VALRDAMPSSSAHPLFPFEAYQRNIILPISDSARPGFAYAYYDSQMAMERERQAVWAQRGQKRWISEYTQHLLQHEAWRGEPEHETPDEEDASYEVVGADEFGPGMCEAGWI